MDFIIDTCNAGHGTLAVTIDGLSKVAMDCTEVEQGYKVRYTPLSPGDYYIGIKYNGHHIAGSPFKVLTSWLLYKVFDFASAPIVTLIIKTSLIETFFANRLDVQVNPLLRRVLCKNLLPLL